MVSMETDLFRGLGVVRHWGKEGKHIVKSGSTSVVQLDQLSLLGREMGKQGHAHPPQRTGYLSPPDRILPWGPPPRSPGSASKLLVTTQCLSSFL